ncbi:MAG: ATP-dependent DNA helicase RecQ [Candidatus Acidiferrales bacterium]|jgi:ATP-dependent DNA helicase RecQ
MTSEPDLLEPLQRYWGYDSFRPLQERIVRSLLAGRDTCVVMATGGGKSLCYQLPASLASDRTAIVISPLIALMQDQTAQLAQIGIEAAVLNSSLAPRETESIMRKAGEGQYRMLYLSPERLARQDTIEWLRGVPVSFFVIDEAHCISEWGHEFRPEYRQLSNLRAQFPDRPIAAFTASATQQVRHDIIEQLQLRDPDKYIASFHRPNLKYIVKKCDSKTQFPLLVAAIRAHPEGAIIVYSPTIAGVAATIAKLEENGIAATGYHGRMDASTRRQNQELWMSGEARVIVGTVAFGLGINKPDVRAVIHLSLPKSIEQYYQEAGRGGRDGRPADCLLLWRPRDAGLHAYFIGAIEDSAEKERAWQRYHTIRDFVECGLCRHFQICRHFGENTKWTSCGACDVCGYDPDWTVLAAKNKPAKRIEPAKEPERPSQAPPLIPMPQVEAPGFAELRAYLREWRRATARSQDIPAFIVMHDTSLDDLCKKHPSSLSEIRQVSGFGARKTELYGQQILEALQRFREGAR